VCARMFLCVCNFVYDKALHSVASVVVNVSKYLYSFGRRYVQNWSASNQLSRDATR